MLLIQGPQGGGLQGGGPPGKGGLSEPNKVLGDEGDVDRAGDTVRKSVLPVLFF